MSWDPVRRQGLPESLEMAYLRGVVSEDLIALAPCRRLKVLNLNFNAIELGALAEVGLPETLEVLCLRKTNVKRNDLRTVARCTRLQTLDLSETNIDLRNCGDLRLPPSLTELDLGGAILDASSFQMLAKLPRLEKLALDEAEFTDDAAGVRLASTLEWFSARSTGAGRNVVRAISGARGLSLLNLHETGLDDAALGELGPKPQMTRLLLSHNPLTDRCAALLAPCRKLERLELIGTQVTDELFASVPHLLQINDLRLADSEVSEELQTRLLREKRAGQKGMIRDLRR
jgi:Leucine-rich repeat (LRR) protein